MLIIYNISVRFYLLAIYIVSIWNHKARLWIKGRKNIFANLKQKLAGQTNLVWFHVSSLGEFEQGRPLIEEYKKRFPERKILLTFFSPSGFEIRKNYSEADFVFYLPLDTKHNASQFLDIVKPQEAFFVKYDFWYHFITQLHYRNIPVFLVSAVFRPDQIFFKKYGQWYIKILHSFQHIFVQDQKSADLLISNGLKKVSVSGDTRLDRVLLIAKNPKPIEIAKVFTQDKFCVVCGSTWPPDEEILFNYILNCPENFVFILAPHEIGESHISFIEKKIPGYTIRFSKASFKDVCNYKVLIIDNIGMLSSLYQFAKLAYIGGGFGQGIHNTLEPAAYGIPVIFGPNYHKFNEANELVNLGAFFTVNSKEAFVDMVNRLYFNSEFLKNASNITKTYIFEGRGATDRIFSVLYPLNT